MRLLESTYPPVEEFFGNLPFTQEAARIMMNAPQFSLADKLNHIGVDQVLSSALREQRLREYFRRVKNPTGRMIKAIRSINGIGCEPVQISALRLTPRVGWVLNHAIDRARNRLNEGEEPVAVSTMDLMYGILKEGESNGAGVLKNSAPRKAKKLLAAF